MNHEGGKVQWDYLCRRERLWGRLRYNPPLLTNPEKFGTHREEKHIRSRALQADKGQTTATPGNTAIRAANGLNWLR